MSETARRRLRKNLKEVGLLRAPILNERTGHIVGGHQRLDALDALHRNKHYELDVAMIDVDEKTEKTINIALNNERAQGMIDFTKLQSILPQVSVEDLGFEARELALLIPAMEAPMNAPTLAQMQDVERTAQAVTAQREAERAARAAANPEDEKDHRSRVQAMRAVLRETRTSRFLREGVDSQDTEYFIIAQFPTKKAKAAFLKSLALKSTERFISGEEVMKLVEGAIGGE